ncbi:MAG: Ig-like domain-containing protein [Candidatus Binatia bacterium]|nr:Ig-like domain-containing protein [Candidatus Binatia bacterium]
MIGVAVALCALAAPGLLQAATLSSLRLDRSDQTVAPARTIRIAAVATMADGTVSDVTADATWKTDDADLARFISGDPGALRTRRPGVVQITASVLGKTASAVITIDPGDVVELITRPGTKRVEIDRPMAFTARLVHESGYQRDVTDEARWTTRNPDVAGVKNGGTPGRVLPRSLGTTFIRVRHPPTGLKNTDGKTQVLPAIGRVRFQEKSIVLGRGMTTDLRVLGQHGDLDVRTGLTEDLEFSTDGGEMIDLVATGKDAGQVTALKDGITTVRVYDRARKIGTPKSRAVVIVVAGVLEELEILPNPLKVNAADVRNASVFGLLTSGLRTGNLRKLVEWFVEDPELASVGKSGNDVGTVKGKEAGTTTLLARYDEFDVVSTAIDNLVVRGRVESVTLEPTEATIGLELEYLLRAYGNRDDSTRSNISGSVNWSTDPDGVVSIDDAGRMTGLVNGVTTVTATDPKTGLGASAEVTVAGRLTSLTVPTVRVDEGDEKKAKAYGNLSSGLQTSDLRLVVDWSVKNAMVAQVGNGGPAVAGERRLDSGEVFGREIGTTRLTAVEPITGLGSKQAGNLVVRRAEDPPSPNANPAPIEPPSVRDLSVVVEPGNDGEVATGVTETYKARSLRSDGSKKNISDKCDWRIDDTSIATVDNVLPKKGGVTGVRLGSTTVHIDCNGLTASGLVEVVGDVIGVTIQPDGFTGAVGETKQLRARVNFSGGGFDDVTREVDWSSTNPDVATVENDNEVLKGRVTFHELGEALIFAVDATGHVGTSTATVDK